MSCPLCRQEHAFAECAAPRATELCSIRRQMRQLKDSASTLLDEIYTEKKANLETQFPASEEEAEAFSLCVDTFNDRAEKGQLSYEDVAAGTRLMNEGQSLLHKVLQHRLEKARVEAEMKILVLETFQ